ncbi:MAG: acyl-CoA thioester hydrolase [Clostridia bacterium]|nr:acyl-CoA thioester hydrolase [Clostridia bacterium]MDN5322315.1 acyl-CoA thioester hydrolase [Clostridia bacterium]
MKEVGNMPEGFNFFYKLRVRYHEVDSQRIVFNANYLFYLDIAWTEYLRHLGLDYAKLSEANEFDTVVVKTVLEYKKPAYFDEILQIFVRIVEMGNSSFRVEFLIYKDESEILVLKGETIYVTYFPRTASTGPIPGRIRKIFSEFEGLNNQ